MIFPIKKMAFLNKIEKLTHDFSSKASNFRFKIRKILVFLLASIVCYIVYEFVFVQFGFYTKHVTISSHTNSTRADEENIVDDAVKEVDLVTETNGFLFRNATWKYDVGKWLHNCHESIPYVSIQEKFFGNNCLNKCNDNGVCNYETGVCTCRMGYKGPDCSEIESHPCNLPSTELFPAGPWVASLCSAQCDERTSKCKCGPDSKFPGRYVRDFCGLEGGPKYTGKVNPEILYSKNESKIGWCNAEFDPKNKYEHLNHCFCGQDGFLGRFCEIRNLAYCINGCGGNGECESGYCRCKDGWYGVDCSIPSMNAFNFSFLPSWMTETNEVKVNENKYEIFRIKRKRPLIYVYDLPGKYNFHLFENRQMKHTCAPWFYGFINETIFYGALYAHELAVYEALMSSQHRTMDAELADYFFVPVLGGCIIPSVGQTPDFGHGPKHMGLRNYLAAEYYLEAYEYITEKYPYWDKNEGKDHLWVFPWDEGACSAPQMIWNSIMITSFGNTMTHHPNSTTAYNPDSWNMLPKELRGDHPCYDPAKDIVLPAWKDPNPRTVNLRLWQNDFSERTTLFYFNGNLGFNYSIGRPEPGYSMGIRQKVAYYFSSMPNIQGDLGIKSQKNVTVKFAKSLNYALELASSRFCGAFPGDGFSARMEDAILSGCIPVIIQDGIHLAFENFLNFDDFTVRINESDIPNMIQILEGISESKVKSMLQAIQGLWERYTYHSTIKAEAKRQLEEYEYAQEWAKAYNQLQGDDALATMFQILTYKLYNDPWRKASKNVSQS